MYMQARIVPQQVNTRVPCSKGLSRNNLTKVILSIFPSLALLMFFFFSLTSFKRSDRAFFYKVPIKFQIREVLV